jgi:acetyl esterase/lipase
MQALTEPHFRSERNVAYGSHPSQILDIYYPRVRSSAPAPVLVFVHGGGFRGGSPAGNAYQGRAALEQGAMYVALGYRVIPDARFPDSVEDVERGLRWLLEHIGELGGDPGRIVLAGHSAGAMLAGWIGLRHSSLPADSIKGLVLISGFYDLVPQSAEIINAASPRYVPHLAQAIERVPPHTVLVVGNDDFPRAMPDAQALLAALQARGAAVEFFVEAADHYTANRGFITADTPVFRAVQRMLSAISIADELHAAIERIDEELQAIPDERWTNDARC